MTAGNTPPESAGSPRPPTRRRRNSVASRAAIVAAARTAFADLGYSRTTIREVAQRAGVTHGLIIRHFGSKERLFVASVPGPRDLDEVIRGDPATLAERLATSWVERMETVVGDDPLVALIRSAGSDEGAATRLLNAMLERGSSAYKRVLHGDDVDGRLGLMSSQLIGITFTRYVLKTGPFAEMPPQELIRHLTGFLHYVLNPGTGRVDR